MSSVTIIVVPSTAKTYPCPPSRNTVEFLNTCFDDSSFQFGVTADPIFNFPEDSVKKEQEH